MDNVMMRNVNAATRIVLWIAAASALSFGSMSLAHQNDQPDRKREFRYAVTKVSGLGAGKDLAWGMNDLGDVVGEAIDPVSAELRPFFWNGRTTYDLGSFGGDRGRSYDINNHRWIVGASRTTGSPFSDAFIWKGQGEIIALEEFSGTRDAAAFAINDHNQIVGTTMPSQGPRFIAVIWEDEKIKSINTLGDDISTEGRDINEDGYALGIMGPNPYNAVAFMWNGKESIPIEGSLGDELHVLDVWGLNEARTFVGRGQVDLNNRYRPLAHHNGKWHNLIRPITDKGFDRGVAWDINDRNQIVGEIRHQGLDEYFGFIAQSGDGIQILNDFLPPHNAWNIKTARAINEHGQIAATGETAEPPAGTYALLLTPIEPEMILEIVDGPLRADAINTFTISNAQPGATIKFFYGKKGGGKRIPGCDALAAMTQIDDPVAFGEAIADANGNAELDIYIPPRGAVHWGFLIQAVDFQNCEESQLVLKKVE